jgi:hypothetical protein
MKPPEKDKISEQLTTPDSFCWNEMCRDYGRVNAGNLRKFGFTRKGRQRWQCKTCESVVAETHGTVFHGKRHEAKTILDCLAMLADRNSLAAIRCVKGVSAARSGAGRRSVPKRGYGSGAPSPRPKKRLRSS